MMAASSAGVPHWGAESSAVRETHGLCLVAYHLVLHLEERTHAMDITRLLSANTLSSAEIILLFSRFYQTVSIRPEWVISPFFVITAID